MMLVSLIFKAAIKFTFLKPFKEIGEYLNISSNPFNKYWSWQKQPYAGHMPKGLQLLIRAPNPQFIYPELSKVSEQINHHNYAVFWWQKTSLNQMQFKTLVYFLFNISDIKGLVILRETVLPLSLVCDKGRTTGRGW
ncbi:FERM and PDZ domain-containing protein 3 [Platysternon megacephalum]|uniref:FERM and PDZ domain-containing protein 3 n=1 Tax=Platysternon megacephalum TaxID=55544 RepID=A0A4D9ECZ7_9SAUR|nr:FERM and PDZ domain-containing protein 3 [Platysternon megacephalum]